MEWVAISFSSAGKWKVKGKSLSRVRLLATPWTAAYQAPPSMGFSRQEYWSGVPSPRSLSLLILAGLLCRGGTFGKSSLDVMLVANSEGSKYRKLSLLWPPRLSSSMTLGKGLPVRTPSCLCGCEEGVWGLRSSYLSSFLWYSTSFQLQTHRFSSRAACEDGGDRSLPSGHPMGEWSVWDLLFRAPQSRKGSGFPSTPQSTGPPTSCLFFRESGERAQTDYFPVSWGDGPSELWHTHLDSMW